MGMQVSCGVHTEMPPQESVRTAAEGSRRCVPRTGAPEGVPDRGGAYDARPCPHADIQ